MRLKLKFQRSVSVIKEEQNETEEEDSLSEDEDEAEETKDEVKVAEVSK